MDEITNPLHRTLRNHHRISVELYAMCLAWVASLRSEDPFHKVGSCALNEKNRVIATGYNGLKPGQTLTDEQWLDREGRLKWIIHSEINCLSLCLPGEIRTLAVTTLPCRHCAEKIIDAGTKTVLYGRLYHRDSSSIDLFKHYGIDCRPVAISDARTTVYHALSREGDE